jgi:carotenoid cleavage dioxygenase-like enzyme
LHDLPFFHDAEILQRFGRRVVSFHKDMPARFGIIPRFGAASDTRWFEAKPCYILHVVNCWEDGDWITMDGYRTADPSIVPDKADGDLSSMLAYLRLTASYYRWRFNLVTGETREAPMDDFNAEFCRINTAMGGRKSRYHYVQHIPHDKTLSFKALVKYDGDTGTRQTHDYGDGIYGSESPFAPKHNAQAEDDGYVLTFTTSLHDWSSQCLVFDAKDISHGPLCKINLPQRLPMGFHATWIPGAQVWG